MDLEKSSDDISTPGEGDLPLSRVPTKDQFLGPFAMTLVTLSLLLCIFLVALDLTIVATAIPKITDEFHSLDQVGWYGSAFFLTIASFQSTWGKLYKYFDLKRSFIASIFVFEVGSLICGVSRNSVTLIVGRAIAGCGGAGLSAGAYTIIGFTAPPKQRPIFIGLVALAFCVSSVLGPLLGGIFTQNLSWRWCFYINLPIGGVAVASIIIFFHTPEAARPLKATWTEKLLQMDLPGSFIIMGAAVCYLLAMQWGGTTKSWRDSDVIGTLIGFGLLVIAFIIVEYFSGERALLVGRILKDRTIMALCAFIFFSSGIFFILLYYLPIYFQATRGVSAEKSGIDNVPLVLASSIFSLVSGIIITVTGHYVPILIVGSACSLAGAALTYTLDIDSPSREWIGYQALVGIGMGLIFQLPQAVAQATVHISDLSTVTATVLFFQTIGAAIFVSAGQAGFANRLIERLPSTAPGVDPVLVIGTGATELRGVFNADQIPGILIAYMDGLRLPFIIVIACASMTVILSVFPRWENIKAKNPLLAGA